MQAQRQRLQIRIRPRRLRRRTIQLNPKRTCPNLSPQFASKITIRLQTCILVRSQFRRQTPRAYLAEPVSAVNRTLAACRAALSTLHHRRPLPMHPLQMHLPRVQAESKIDAPDFHGYFSNAKVTPSRGCLLRFGSSRQQQFSIQFSLHLRKQTSIVNLALL